MPEGVGYGPQNTASTGLELNIIGNYAYAYNQVASNNLQSIANTLDFQTGNYLFVGKWTVCGTVNNSGVSVGGGVDQFYLKLNEVTVMSLKTDTGDSSAGELPPQALTVPIIIPAFTKVEVSAVCTINNAAWILSNTLTGRIFK